MVIWTQRMIEEQEREDAERIKGLYDEVLKVRQIGQDLYKLYEVDTDKGYRISTINSRTGQTIFCKRFCGRSSI